MRSIAMLLALSLLSAGGAAAPAAADSGARCVVLVHGLGRTGASLWAMKAALSGLGYRVVTVDYPSTEIDLDQAQDHLDAAVAQCGAQEVDFVTHSMGGILLRRWIEATPDARIGRAVMLAPPNQGSEIIDQFQDLALFQTIVGPAGLTLGTRSQDGPAKLPPVAFELGVIAGDLSLNPFYSYIIPGRDDGKVSVRSTRVAGMSDHITLPVSHTFLMNDAEVMLQTIHFLREGRFDHGTEVRAALRDP